MKRILFVALIGVLYGSVVAKSFGRELFVTGTGICDTTEVSLFQDGWFVVRGEMSRMWDGRMRLAVTDPIRNHGHELVAQDGKHFQKTIPMRGPLQQIYLYVPGTITIPVCTGDTIDIRIGDDDIWLSSAVPKADLDLQLAIALYRKVRKNEIRMGEIMGKYYKAKSSSQRDSLQRLMVDEGRKYQSRYMTVIDTFVAAHGTPRLESYFRLSGFYDMLRMWRLTDIQPSRYNPEVSLDSVTTSMPFDAYCGSFLLIPNYREFSLAYINSALYDELNRKHPGSYGHGHHLFMLNGFRGVAPSPLLADLAALKYWNDTYRYSGPDEAAGVVKHFHDATVTPEIAAEYHKVMHDVLRLSRGEEAPRLTLTDGSGGRYTLDDFKGKYLYLDFWDYGCKPCLKEFAVIPELKNHFADRMEDIRLVTVCASRTSKGKLEKFARQHGMTECNLILDRDNSDPCYDVGVFPTYILIDPDGRIVEFNASRPSEIMRRANSDNPTQFEKLLMSGDEGSGR